MLSGLHNRVELNIVLNQFCVMIQLLGENCSNYPSTLYILKSDWRCHQDSGLLKFQALHIAEVIMVTHTDSISDIDVETWGRDCGYL